MSFVGKVIVQRPGHRDRLAAALQRKFTGEVPFFESNIDAEIVDAVLGRPLGKKNLHLPAEDYVEFLQRTGIDVGYLYVGWFLGRENYTDKEGRVHYVDGTIKTRADLQQIEPPSLDPVKRCIEEFLEAAEGTNLGAYYALDTSASVAITATGPTDGLLQMYDDPGFIDEFSDRVEEHLLPLAECVCQYPLDAIWITGLRCANAGPMVSWEMHERFVLPRLEKAMDIIRPHGIPVILHSDGDNSIFMDWIIETGFAGLHPIEPGIGRFDIYELKKTYGDKICLFGNIDVGTVLSDGRPDEVREDVREHIRRLATGGGYVCGSSHDISYNIPFDNFCAMARTICSTVVTENHTLEQPAAKEAGE